MGQAYGHNFFCGTGLESTYGTGVAASEFYEVEKFAVKATQKNLPKRLLRHVGVARKIKGKMDVGGPITLPMLWTGTERWLKQAFGACATTGPSSGNYTHVFSGAAALPTGMSIIANHDSDNIGGSSCFRYTGCQVNKLTLKQSIENFLMMDVDVIGANRALIVKPTPTFPTFAAIDYTQISTLIIFPSLTPLVVGLKDFELSIDNGIYGDGYRLGSNVRQFMGRGDGGRKVTIKAQVEFSDTSVFGLYKDLTDIALQLKWVKDANTEITLDMPVVSFEGEDPSAENSGPYYLNMEGTGYIGTTDGDEVTLTLKNQTASVA